MYNFSFICRASKIDKKGFAPIELSIITNGTRTYVILPIKFEPTLYNKMMASKKNNEVLEYTSSIIQCAYLRLLAFVSHRGVYNLNKFSLFF